jgi:hypothetical protein
VNVIPCAFWPAAPAAPAAPAEPPTTVSGDGPSNLMVQNLRDPARPYGGGLRPRGARACEPGW